MDTSKNMIYKLITIICLLLLLVIFTLLNTQQVNISLLFWTIHMPTALVILLPLAAGLLIGWLGIPLILAKRRRNLLRKEEK